MAINTNRELIGFAAFCAAQTVPTKIRSPGPGWMIPSFHRVLIEIGMVLGCPLPDHRHHNGFGSGTPSRDHAAGMNGCLKRGRRSSTSPARKRSSNACSSVCSHSWKTWEEGLRLLKHIKTVLSDELSTNGDTTRLDIKKNISISPQKRSAAGPGFEPWSKLQIHQIFHRVTGRLPLSGFSSSRLCPGLARRCSCDSSLAEPDSNNCTAATHGPFLIMGYHGYIPTNVSFQPKTHPHPHPVPLFLSQHLESNQASKPPSPL